MYYQPQNRPQALLYRSPEDRRVFEQHLRNVRRLIDYNNRRVLIGLALVSYPPALALFPSTHKDYSTMKKCTQLDFVKVVDYLREAGGDGRAIEKAAADIARDVEAELELQVAPGTIRNAAEAAGVTIGSARSSRSEQLSSLEAAVRDLRETTAVAIDRIGELEAEIGQIKDQLKNPPRIARPVA